MRFILSAIWRICLATNCLVAVLGGAQCHAGLVFQPAPPDQQKAVESWCKKHLPGQSWPASATNWLAEDIKTGIAVQSYYVEPKDVAAGRLFSAVKRGAWTFLITDKDIVIGCAWCAADSALCTGFGTNVDPAALSVVEQLPQTKAQDYEVRDFGAGLFRGLWLHGKTNEILIPADSGYGSWVPYRPISEAQLLKISQPYERKAIPMAKKAHDQFIQFREGILKYERAMMRFEKAHRGSSDRISLFHISDVQSISSTVEVVKLEGKRVDESSVGYSARVVFKDKRHSIVKHVQILTKL